MARLGRKSAAVLAAGLALGADAAPSVGISTLTPENATDSSEPHLEYVQPGLPILYAISTGEVYHATRAAVVLQTWCRNINSCVFYSDASNPDAEPHTIAINMDGLKGTVPGMRLAQLRYLRIMRHAIEMISLNREGLFTENQWLVITDDDTYVFHNNMLTYLLSLDHNQPIYTGHTLPDQVYPVDGDGDGHTLSTSISVHFACGGGGTVFSRAALENLKAVGDSCVSDSMPGGLWDGWQSDWMLGSCADRAGVPLLDQKNNDRFGQFLYKPGEVGVLQLPDDPGTKQFCQHDKGVCEAPVSLHPLHDPISMTDVRDLLPDSATAPVENKRILLQEDQHVSVDDGR